MQEYLYKSSDVRRSLGVKVRLFLCAYSHKQQDMWYKEQCVLEAQPVPISWRWGLIMEGGVSMGESRGREGQGGGGFWQYQHVPGSYPPFLNLPHRFTLLKHTPAI